MSRFTPESEEHKQALIERALKLKPKYLSNVIATDKGWVQPHANGYLELLVSFTGLDALLGEAPNVDQDVEAEPIEVQGESVPPVETVEKEETTQEESQKDATDEQEPSTVKRKGGRPKKAVEEKVGE